MKRYSVLALTVTLAVTLSACSDFLNINDDPNTATPDQLAQVPGNLLPPAATALATNKTTEHLYVRSWQQTWSGAFFGLFVDGDDYVVAGTQRNNTYVTPYSTVTGNLTEIIGFTESLKENPDQVPYSPSNVQAQAEILRQYTYLYMSEFFGAIPYEQANQIEQFPNPEPDPQEDIIRGVIANLDSAVTQINPNEPGITSSDFFYNGNLENWRRLANSVKLKAYFLLLSGNDSETGSDIEGVVSDGTVEEEINALVGEPLIAANAQNFAFRYQDQATQRNGFFAVGNQFAGGENVHYACSEALVDEMLDLDDPRIRLYCQEDQVPGAPEYTGLAQGSAGSPQPPPPDFATGTIQESMVSDLFHRPTAPEEFATAAEIWLLRAEWQLRQDNPSTARSNMVTGIEQSVNELNTYASEMGVTPISQSDLNNYTSSLPSASNLTLEDVQRQQWLDYFERAPEGWTHWRRTKVPDLEAPSTATTSDRGIIRRINVPTAVLSANPNIESRNKETPMWFEGSNSN
jgi:hypothetical protein